MRPNKTQATLEVEFLFKLRTLLHTVGEMVDDYRNALNLGPKEVVIRLEDLHKKQFDKEGDRANLVNMIETLEQDIDDGCVLDLKFHAIHDCADDGIIIGDNFDLDRIHPDYQGAVAEIKSLP